MSPNRREFLTAGSAAVAAAAQPGGAIVVDPKPLFDFSPHFYMQFMEPLGVADSSVEASWDYERDDWRKDLVETTKDLAPDVLRWGGIYSRYYRWREGLGPARQRPPMYNYAWGGWETHRVGTHEFVDFARRVGAEPLYCVNFSGDGVERYRKDNRWADAKEAAEWVSYANDPDHAERKRNGSPQPLNIKLWQLGNETSYGKEVFSRDQSIRTTVEFARAMRQRDPSIQLIGWGDYGRGTDARELWAPELLKQAGEHLDYVAIHMMGMNPRRKETLLRGNRYQKDPAAAWEELLELSGVVEQRVSDLEQVLAAQRATQKITVTEGHLSMVPHNANPILLEWLSAAYHARSMNIYHRHGAKVRMATGADFAGNRWTVNAVMLETPRGRSFLTPVGSIMRLFKRHNGKQGVAVPSAPSDLDVAASRTGNRVFLHVLNKSFGRAVEVRFAVAGMQVTGGRVFEIAPEDPRTAVGLDQPAVFTPRERALGAGAWRFPPVSVSAVELEVG
ncbi:MAG: alpha-L-arabinofuranosidase C-terminal domain-containing protein [Bryobacterales bacterium]|nr:alpha-L-arabinofuranosidase C-terminal domain-containing protein [Bryobacterales bacterium]